MVYQDMKIYQAMKIAKKGFKYIKTQMNGD